MKNCLVKLMLALIALPLLTGPAGAQTLPDGSKTRPLRVILVPADGGTEDGTKADSRRSSTP